jgi:hypothetical protein
VIIPSSSAHFQPDRPIIDQLVAALGSDDWDRLDVPVAYSVLGGVRLLEERFRAIPRWTTVEKRFLVGIDWCRSEPLALDALAKLPNASVRVPDGRRVVAIPGCRPVRSYHPKAFIFSKKGHLKSGVIGCLVGSGNLSRNGLSFGHELDWWSCTTEASPQLSVALHDTYRWFEELWTKSTPYPKIRDRYRTEFEAHQRTESRATTDDDSVPEIIIRQRGLKPDDLIMLRSFDNLWIDTGSMYSNLGPGRSGNQLELKRYSRVFFGFPARDLVKNSPIGGIAIVLRGTLHTDRHLRYGDNQMDKLDLPVPAGGSIDYRDQTILFTRKIGPSGEVRFTLRIAGSGDRSVWRSRSRKMSTLFKFGGASTREFGVF